MKKIILLIIILIPLLFIKIPKYKELNHLIIIEKIGFDCSNNTIYLKEIIPLKDDNGIEYKYIIHKYNNNFNSLLKNDKYYLNKDVLITNCSKYKNSSFKKIINVKNIKKELSKNT